MVCFSRTPEISRKRQSAKRRSLQIFLFFFTFVVAFFFVERIITTTVSRTPFWMTSGELFSIVLFTAIIKCLWIVQRPIFKSLFLLFEGSGKSISGEIKLFFFRGKRWSGEAPYIKMLAVDSG